MDSKFYQYIELIIDNLEGGYYHPNMLNTQGWSEQTKKVYANSGETMYGMDRQAGADLFKSGAGKQFWDLIDAQGASTKWKWNYMPPKSSDLAKQLKKLATEVQYKQFCKLADIYLTDPQTRKIVESSPRLMVHFFYGCWNGAGFFKNYAKKITAAVQSGTTDTSKLAKIAMDHRRTYFSPQSPYYPQFVDGADKITKKIFPQLPSEPNSMPVWPWIVGGGLLLAGGVWWWIRK